MRAISLLLLGLPGLVHAGPEVNGYIETYLKYWVHGGSGGWTWNENRLQIQLEGNPSEALHYYAELRLRGFGFPRASSVGELGEKEGVFPWGVEIRELYADIYGLLHPDLDLRVGRQVVAWGTADRLNPTSNISPYDLEDFLDLGERLGVDALRARFSAEPWSVEVDFVPMFTPSVFPPPEWSGAFLGSLKLPQGLRNLKDILELPSKKLSESSEAAFKVSTILGGWDLSLSYFQGRDLLPILTYLEVVPVDTLGNVDVEVRSCFPKVRVVGGDFSGSLFKLGVWGEGALFFPEDVVLTKVQPGPPGAPVRTDSTLLSSDRPYFRYVLGGDYTFSDGTYLNFQYIHGLFHERGEDLEDYFTLRVERTFLNGELKLSPLTLTATVSDWEAPRENWGAAWIPEVVYTPVDNLELKLGALVLCGKGENIFSQLEERDEVYLRFKVSF